MIEQCCVSKIASDRRMLHMAEELMMMWLVRSQESGLKIPVKLSLVDFSSLLLRGLKNRPLSLASLKTVGNPFVTPHGPYLNAFDVKVIETVLSSAEHQVTPFKEWTVVHRTTFFQGFSQVQSRLTG